MAVAATPIVIQAAPMMAPAPAAPPISGFVTVWGVTINPMVGVLVMVIAVGVYLLWRAQRDAAGKNSFDFWDLVMDTLPDGRRASSIKLFFMGSFLLSSWVVIDQEIKSSPLLPSIFGIYMLTWGASLIAKVIFDQKTMPAFNLPGTREA